ncbi:MAG: ATP-binding protein, partial [Desulfobulbaceae bacterium]|nr:ATP-binding protein [Desulfobulbaceae bacterium]
KKVSKNDRAFLPGIGWAECRYPNRGGHAARVQERLGETSGESLNYFSFQNNLIENSIEGVLACNREGIVVVFNKTLEEMLGYSQSEVCNKMLFSQFFHAEDFNKFTEKLYGEEYGIKKQLPLFETSLINKSGDSVPVQVSAKVMFEDDEDIGFATFFWHPTETGSLEQKPEDQATLLQQHKLISLGRLAASVVHEINNPLAGILNYLGLMIKILGRESPLDAENLTKFGRYLDLVESEIRRCSIIMSNLLAFSRKSNLEFSEVDIDELLERCIILSQHKLDLQNIEIRKRTDSEVPKVWGDFNQIQQCVINLIFNAIDAMPDGGTLTLESSFNRDKGIVRIRVQDTGYGIAKEHLTHIFDPFYTTKTEGEGFGLGLSTVHGIIERHKGSINLKTEVGEGTIFTIDLPVAKMGTQD